MLLPGLIWKKFTLSLTPLALIYSFIIAISVSIGACWLFRPVSGLWASDNIGFVYAGTHNKHYFWPASLNEELTLFKAIGSVLIIASVVLISFTSQRQSIAESGDTGANGNYPTGGGII